MLSASSWMYAGSKCVRGLVLLRTISAGARMVMAVSAGDSILASVSLLIRFSGNVGIRARRLVGSRDQLFADHVQVAQHVARLFELQLDVLAALLHREGAVAGHPAAERRAHRHQVDVRRNGCDRAPGAAPAVRWLRRFTPPVAQSRPWAVSRHRRVSLGRSARPALFMLKSALDSTLVATPSSLAAMLSWCRPSSPAASSTHATLNWVPAARVACGLAGDFLELFLPAEDVRDMDGSCGCSDAACCVAAGSAGGKGQGTSAAGTVR
jgi:hypothetical protein